MRYVIIVLMTLSCLTACAPTLSKQPASVRLILPTVKNYSNAETNKVADELDACGVKCAMTREFLKDFKKMRDETRLAISKLTN